MAIFRPAAPIGAISGNLGGVNFVLGKNGPVVRQRNRRTSQTTKAAHNQRQIFSFLRNAWRNLTDNQRTAWRQAALAHPRRNRLGLTNRITGYQFFMQLNSFWVTLQNQIPTLTFSDPPSLVTRAPFLLLTWSVTAAGSKTLTTTAPTPPVPETQIFAMYGARTFSSAPRKFWNSFRFTGTFFARPTIDLTIGWDDAIGDPAPGEQCWINAVQVAIDQIPGAPQPLSTIAQ